MPSFSPDLFTGKHKFHPEIDLVTTLPPQKGVYDVMLRAIPRGSTTHEVYGTVGQINLLTGEMRILQPEDADARQPVELNMPGVPEFHEKIRAWIGAQVVEQVTRSGYQPFGDFFESQE